MGKFEQAPQPRPLTAADRLTESAEEGVATFFDDAREWCIGKMWLPRALLLAYLAMAFVRHLFDPLYGSLLFSGITLGIHELGHVVFGFAGHFISSLMGSGSQVLAPIVTIVMFLRQEDYFGMAVGGAWLSFSLFNLATYVADARVMELPLVSLGSDPEHDWHYLLGKVGLLEHEQGLAFLIRATAFLAGLASLAFGAWLIWTMITSRRVRVPV